MNSRAIPREKFNFGHIFHAGEDEMERNNWANQNSQRIIELKEEEEEEEEEEDLNIRFMKIRAVRAELFLCGRADDEPVSRVSQFSKRIQYHTLNTFSTLWYRLLYTVSPSSLHEGTHNLGTRCRWVVNFTPRLLYPP